jgi:hypothetical protein
MGTNGVDAGPAESKGKKEEIELEPRRKAA